MHPIWFFSIPLFAIGVGTACSSEDSPTPFNDVDVVGTDRNPEGIPYPSDDWGARPRDGNKPGQRLPNFSFQGYPDSRKDDGLQVVSMADYFDPSQQHHKLMFLMVVVAWCPHCQAETRAVVKLNDSFRANGIRVVQTIVEGKRRGSPLSLADVDDWVDTMTPPFSVLIDVNAKRLGTVATIRGVPWNALIDTRSMEILSIAEGELAYPASYANDGLNWVATHEPRP